MAHPEVEEYQLYFSRLRPIYAQLFNMAHAITGNCDQAEYCLQYALTDCWALGCAAASHHGFREDLRNMVVRVACKSALSHEGAQAEFDWDGLQIADTDSLLPRQIAQEPMENRRILALRYGCGLSARRIAQLCGTDARRIQTQLRRFEARVRHRLPPAQRRRCESLISRSVRSQLALPSPQAPELGKVFRAFQADAASINRPSRLPVRILHGALAVLLGILCVAAFWLAAVLLQPPALEEISPQTTVIDETPSS